MSNVAGVVLTTSSLDEDGYSDSIAIRNVQLWLFEHAFGPLKNVEQHFGGSKHPQLICWGGGYNYFPEEEFAAFVIAQPWQLPEEVVLIIYFEHDPPKVWRPAEK